MTNEQLLFFSKLQQIQEQVVSSQKYSPDDMTKETAYNLTYDTIFKILELIDGYTAETLTLDLIDDLSGNSLKSGIQLHDKYADYLTSY
ncbi:hypothetical protein IGI37_000890 [Enterococcus sp. AZ194]|uniref:hypothetical protein n=1 Tax=Enterococcus sp. AZ194 TaxID=2774629 RepID=UPI003F218071